jgi:hypothetical protein
MKILDLFSFELIDLSEFKDFGIAAAKYDGCNKNNGQCGVGCGCGKSDGYCGSGSGTD